MANFVIFHMIPSGSVKINEDDPETATEFSDSTVKEIIVKGDPWVCFDDPNYGGDFVILKDGKQPFPSKINKEIIQSMRRIKEGIYSSQVIFYPLSFYKGPEMSFQSKQPEIDGKFFSLRVVKGAVIFYDEKHYGGEKRILLNGDEVQNYTAVKLTYIGKSMKTAMDILWT